VHGILLVFKMGKGVVSERKQAAFGIDEVKETDSC
jgi:hypothetical protein